MPSVYDIKPRFQALLRPLVRRLAAAGTTANQVTVAAMQLISKVVDIADGLPTVQEDVNSAFEQLVDALETAE